MYDPSGPPLRGLNNIGRLVTPAAGPGQPYPTLDSIRFDRTSNKILLLLLLADLVPPLPALSGMAASDSAPVASVSRKRRPSDEETDEEPACHSKRSRPN
jgi:hypothetical protein